MTHQTVSDEDFKMIMSVPAVDIIKYSNVGVKVLKDSQELYSIMARSIADVIIGNNAAGDLSKIILPVGPTPQYPILAKIFNEEKVSLEKVWFFFMDEYLDWEGRLIQEDHPMSFKGYMNKNFFDLISTDLGLSNGNIIFPDPVDPDQGLHKIDELGGIDVCYGGIGFHGHIAFNEPYDTYYSRMTIDKFLHSKTRVVELNPDTFIINSICGIGGNSYGLPPRAVTIGMEPIFGAKKIELYCDGGDLNWQLATFRLACMHPPTLDRPATLLQLHEDPMETVTIFADELTARPISEAPK